MRKLLLVASVLPAVLLALPAGAADPSSGTLSATSPSVSWSGAAESVPPSDDVFALTVEPVAGQDVQVSVDVPEDADWDFEVYDADGRLVAEGAAGFLGVDESARFTPVAGTYEVHLIPYAVPPGGSYAANASFVPASDEPPVDEEPACSGEMTPDAVEPYVVTGGAPVSYDIAVLLDGVSQAAVQDLFERAAPAYAAHGISLRAVSYASVTMPGGDTADSTDAIDYARDHFGGARPAGSDAVYLATSKDLTDETLGTAVAGQVDCVGGVKSPETAIAVGEVKEENPFELGPIGLDADISLKVFGHELGHLLGAHHHYGNCVEGIGADDVSGDTAPCTLMFNVANFQSMTFGTLEGATIRAYAAEHAAP